jgi:hypothetical protein
MIFDIDELNLPFKTVLSNGEKSDNKQIGERLLSEAVMFSKPSPPEGLLLQDKHILYVQVFGAGRHLNGVILQPANPSLPASDFLSKIQPAIQHANSILPKHSRLVSELIIVAPPNKLFATTDKGTIKTKETLDKFEEEIESGYAALEDGGAGEEWAFEGSVANYSDLKRFVRSAVEGILGHEVPDSGDVFEHGESGHVLPCVRTWHN